jgi:hypothetical protein
MTRAIIFITMLLSISPCAAKDPLYGDMTETQIKAVQMTSLATYAGSHDNCPRFHVVERAVFEEWRDAQIPSEMVATQAFKNAIQLSTIGPMQSKSKNPSDFCLAAWQLFGPNGTYRRQLLEAN